MPTYEYACRDCGVHTEVQQSFTDPPLAACPACGGPVRKVFSAVGITFKGSGFYKTDSRGGTSSSTTPAADATPSAAAPASSSASTSSSSDSGSSSSSASTSSGSSSGGSSSGEAKSA